MAAISPLHFCHGRATHLDSAPPHHQPPAHDPQPLQSTWCRQFSHHRTTPIIFWSVGRHVECHHDPTDRGHGEPPFRHGAELTLTLHHHFRSRRHHDSPPRCRRSYLRALLSRASCHLDLPPIPPLRHRRPRRPNGRMSAPVAIPTSVVHLRRHASSLVLHLAHQHLRLRPLTSTPQANHPLPADDLAYPPSPSPVRSRAATPLPPPEPSLPWQLLLTSRRHDQPPLSLPSAASPLLTPTLLAPPHPSAGSRPTTTDSHGRHLRPPASLPSHPRPIRHDQLPSQALHPRCLPVLTRDRNHTHDGTNPAITSPRSTFDTPGHARSPACPITAHGRSVGDPAPMPPRPFAYHPSLSPSTFLVNHPPTLPCHRVPPFHLPYCRPLCFLHPIVVLVWELGNGVKLVYNC